MNMRKKERLMGLIMAIIMSIAMGILASFIVLWSNPQAAGGQPVVMTYLVNIVLSVVVGIVVALVIPLGKIGKTLTMKANANPPSIKYTLIYSIPMAIGNTLFVGLTVSLFGVLMGRRNMPPEVAHSIPLVPMWLGSWAKLIIPTLIVSYVLAILLSPLIARAIGLGGPPRGKGGPGGPPPGVK